MTTLLPHTARVALAALALALAAITSGLSACSPPRFTDDEINAAPLGRGLPPGFLLGAATAPQQVEGGTDNDWTDWETASYPDGRPHIEDHSTSRVAADSWNRYPQDVAALRYLGANAYRLGIEWSRLEPSEGVWNTDAVEHYRRILLALRAAGITPLLTVYHYTLPRWVAARGGWEWDGMGPAIAAFSGRAGAAFGDLVDDWITINEPSAIVAASYATGMWPPGVSDPRRSLLVYAALIRAHAGMTAALRRTDTRDANGDGRATFIGMAHNLSAMQAASSNALDLTVAALADDVFNEAVPRAAHTGWIRIHLPTVLDLDEYVPDLAGSFDYLGVNYYHRTHMRANLASAQLADLYVPAGAAAADNGWEVYPEGLYQMLLRYARYHLPVYITENGIADATDAQRPRYLRAHLYAIQRAVADGVDVRGYFHWSLVDNFEWSSGYSMRFGLFSVDHDSPTLERIPRPSTDVFREAARGMGLHPSETWRLTQ